MYDVFRLKNFQEYKKIIDIIESCENNGHYEVAVNCAKYFGHNCDWRCKELKKNWLIHFYNFDFYIQYNMYKDLCNLQVKDILSKMKSWEESYQNWLDDYDREQEEMKIQPKHIMGFNKVFKKKRGKR